MKIARLLLATLLLVAQPISTAEITVVGDCILVDAIIAANTDTPVGGCPAGSGADEIILTGDVVLTEGYDSANALPPIDSEITIEGGGFTIENDSIGFHRVLAVTDSSLVLNNATVTGGYSGFGGGMYISAEGQATLVSSTISGNVAYYGGGISNAGALNLYHSVIAGNQTASGGFGFYPCCGGILNSGYLALRFTTVTDNQGYGFYREDAGGIFSSGELVIDESTISDNSHRLSTSAPGGVFASAAIISNSTISGNEKGGIFVSSAAITNSTISGSSAIGLRVEAEGSATVTSTTISGNGSYGLLVDSEATAEVRGSILGQSGTSNCEESGTGKVIHLGGNLDDDGSCGPGFGDLTGLDPVLADNGGSTLTHALLPGSSAIDRAGECGLAADQRGVPRDDGACDSGSYEFVSDPCVLQLRLSASVLQTGESLEVELSLQHRRNQTVTVPFLVWVEDEAGTVIASRRTPPVTLKPGDAFRRRMTLQFPKGVPQGRYFARARIDQMQQGMAEARKRTLTIE